MLKKIMHLPKARFGVDTWLCGRDCQLLVILRACQCLACSDMTCFSLSTSLLSCPDWRTVPLMTVGLRSALGLWQQESEFCPINERLILYFKTKWKLWVCAAAIPHLISLIYFTVTVNYIAPVLFSGIYFPVFHMKVVDNTVCVSPWRFGTSESRVAKWFGDNPYCFE